jgi:hypothetical protein
MLAALFFATQLEVRYNVLPLSGSRSAMTLA